MTTLPNQTDIPDQILSCGREIFDLTEAVVPSPLQFARLTDPQLEWVSRTERRAVWRAGNSIGKSWGQSWDIIHTARGTHPYRKVKAPPVDLLVVGYSFAQMDPLCKKIWDLIPRNEIHPKVRYEPANGFRGFEIPVIPFVSGPGAGSNIFFATYEQGSGRIMGFQVDGAYLDEPPPADVWGEVIPRLNARKGFLRVTFTPTPESPDLEYLRKLVDIGRETNGKRGVTEQQTSIRPDRVVARHAHPEMAAAFQFSREPQPWMSQADIEEALDSYLEEERDMREHGAWYPLQKGRWVSTYTEENYVDFSLSECAGAYLVCSWDHGAQAGKQAAMLSAYRDRETSDPRVWFIDESQSDGSTSVSDDAAAVIAMLDRHKLHFLDVNQWVGDRGLHEHRFFVAKDNKKLMAEIVRQLQRRGDLPPDFQPPRVVVPHKFHGSPRHGAKVMKSAFKKRDPRTGEPLAKVHRRCARFHDSLLKFKGDPRDPCKDIWDSGRYGLERATGVGPPVGWRGQQ